MSTKHIAIVIAIAAILVAVYFYMEDKNKKNIKQGLKEVHLIEQGKMKATSFDDFINEL